MYNRDEKLIERYVNSLEVLHKLFLPMDSLISPPPIIGIKAWDDAVVLNLTKEKLVVSVDGPYTKRLVMKSALLHASTDVWVKGGMPVFALDTLIGPRKDVLEMARSLKQQAMDLKLPILGGNTLFEENTEPRASITVIGKLVIEKPIPDSGAKVGDVIAVIGEPIWGEWNDRKKKAEKMLKTWVEVIKTIKINAAKDVTKGGLISVVYEMEKKSRTSFSLLPSVPFPLSRNMDNFILTLREEEYIKLEELCKHNSCPVWRIGEVKQRKGE